MSWFFGKKKNKDNHSDSSEEEQPQNKGDEFIFVEKQENTGPSDPLYPILPRVPYPPPGGTSAGTQPSTDSSHAEHFNYLNSVPFKFSKELQNSISNDFEMELLRIDEILSFVERIQGQEYEYNFAIENEVSNEFSARQNVYDD